MRFLLIYLLLCFSNTNSQLVKSLLKPSYVRIGVSKNALANTSTSSSTTEATTTVTSTIAVSTIFPTVVNTTTLITTTSSNSNISTNSTIVSNITTTTNLTPTTNLNTTTIAPSTTTEKSLNSSKSNDLKITFENVNVKEHVRPESYFCACDIMVNFCDANCCCDIDCTENIFKTFDCKVDKSNLYDFSYENGLPSCRVNQGWLCVFRDNSKANLAKIYNPNLKDRQKYFWTTNSFIEENNENISEDFYKSGDLIYIYNKKSQEIITFDIIRPVINHKCQVTEPLVYLNNVNYECMTTFEDAKLFQKVFYDALTEGYILKSPKITLKSILNEEAETHDEFMEHLIQVSVSLCNDDSFEKLTCEQLNTTIMNIYDFDFADENYCQSYKIIFRHNFTNILECSTELHFKSQNDNPSNEIWQRFEVIFEHISLNNSAHKVRNVSGNLGYVVGLPLIVGKYVPQNESAKDAENHLVIDYFHNNATIFDRNNSFLYVPVSEDRLCSKKQFDIVNFNENLFSECKIQFENATFIESIDGNFTNTCKKMQSEIFYYLLGTYNISSRNSALYVSEFGSPRNYSRYWIKIIIQNYDLALRVVGVKSKAKNSFVCRNMIIGVNYKFQTIRSTIGEVLNQNILKRAELEVGTRLDIEFKLDEELKVPIYYSAMFFDQSDISNNCSGIVRHYLYIIIAFLIVVILL